MTSRIEPVIFDDGPSPPTQTPWGIWDIAYPVAPGIWGISTASHGGMWLAPERVKQVPSYILDATFNRGQGRLGWFEEDCDVAWVYAVFEKEMRAYWSRFRPPYTDAEIEQRMTNVEASLRRWKPHTAERFYASQPQKESVA